MRFGFQVKRHNIQYAEITILADPFWMTGWQSTLSNLTSHVALLMFFWLKNKQNLSSQTLEIKNAESKNFLRVAGLGSWLLLRGSAVPVLPANVKHKSAFGLKAKEWILTKHILNPELNMTSLIIPSLIISSSLNAVVICDCPSRIQLFPEKIWAVLERTDTKMTSWSTIKIMNHFTCITWSKSKDSGFSNCFTYCCYSP